MLIRFLNKDLDLGSVFKFYEEAPNYLELAEGQKPGLEKAIGFSQIRHQIIIQIDHFSSGFFWTAVCKDWQNYPLSFQKLAIHI